MPRGVPKGRTNNPDGQPRGSRNARLTDREERSMDAENTDDPRHNAAVVTGRAIQAAIIAKGRR
jgi:hypothetical protein